MLAALNLRAAELGAAWNAYRQVGGFLAAVRDFVVTGEPRARDTTVRTLWDTIAGDVARSGRDPVAVLKLLEEVGTSLGSPLKWTGAGKAMDVSDVTARQYVEHLAEAFAVLAVYFWRRSPSIRAGISPSPEPGRTTGCIDRGGEGVQSTLRGGTPATDEIAANCLVACLRPCAVSPSAPSGAAPPCGAAHNGSRGSIYRTPSCASPAAGGGGGPCGVIRNDGPSGDSLKAGVRPGACCFLS